MFGGRYEAISYTSPSLSSNTTMANAAAINLNNNNTQLAANKQLGRKDSAIGTASSSLSVSPSSEKTSMKAVNSNREILSPLIVKSGTGVGNSDAFTIKNKLICDLTRAIQLVQKSYLEKSQANKAKQPLTNSDYQVHELCQQFDLIFLYGLKKPNEAYWKFVLDFTHRCYIADLNRLLNISTYFGRSRAWLYHALNDNLMESYLKCILENKKLVLRFYKKDASLLADEQSISVLLTLVAGLENVEFKLHNDVPYLDHSCWPTHLNVKRLLVDSILNATSDSLSQIVIKNPDVFGDLQKPDSDAASTKQTLKNTRSSSALVKKKNQRTRNFTSSSFTNRFSPNDISFNNSTSTGNSINGNNDETSEGTLSTSEQTQMLIRRKLVNKLIKNNKQNTELYLNSNESANEEDDEEGTNTSMDDFDSSSTTSKPHNYHPNDDEEERIDNEIIKLRKESKMSQSKQRQSPLTTVLGSQDLVDSSQKASDHFDQKIKHLENYSNIIESATSKMDACVNDMSSVYKKYDEKEFNDLIVSTKTKKSGRRAKKASSGDTASGLIESTNEIRLRKPSEEKSLRKSSEEKLSRKSSDVINIEKETNIANSLENQPSSVYDLEPMLELSKEENASESNTIGLNSNETSIYNSDTTEEKKAELPIAKASSSKSLTHSAVSVNENDYLKPRSDFENPLEIKVDNNLKLMLMIDIFQNGQNEELVKFYHATRDHTQGEIESIYVLLTSYGIYILTRNESTLNSEKIYKKEEFLSHNSIDFIELSLGDQAIHFVCFKKIQNCWITTACRKMTNDLIENINIARKINLSLKLPELSVFRESMQQKLAIKKFLANEENQQSIQNIDIKNYSLIYWEDQASVQNHLIHKEGVLYYLNKNATSNATDWKRAYFILKNDVLTQYKTSNDKRPTQVLKLNGEDFSGCRKSSNSSKPYTIELIFASNSNKLFLSAKSEADASDWLQCFCKIISLGNYHTDVPTHICLPCCSVLTTNKIYLCHEDLNSGFYRLLEPIKLQEINRISFDNECPYFCILHDDYESKVENKKQKFWFIYFVDENERNIFITSLKEAWESLFQVPFTIEKCQSSEMRKRCIRSVNLVHKYWTSMEEY